MKYERLFALASDPLSAPAVEELNFVPLLRELVPRFCDGCAIELFGADQPDRRIEFWSCFRDVLEGVPQATASVLPSPGERMQDLPHCGEVAPAHAATLQNLGVDSAISIPLKVEGQVVGSLTLIMASSGRSFGQDDLSSFCNVAGRMEETIEQNWLEGVRPIKLSRGEDLSQIARKASEGELERFVTERELTERRRQQSVVAKLARRSIAEPNLKVILNKAVESVATALDMDQVRVLEYLPDENDFIVRAVSGFPEEQVDQHREPMTGPVHSWFTSTSAERLLVAGDDGESVSDAPGDGSRGGVCVVIRGANSPWGIFQAFSRTPRAFADSDTDFIQTISDIVGQAVERYAADRRVRFQATLLNELGHAIMAVDPEGRFTLWNRQAEKIYRWKESEVLGRYFLDFMVPPAEQARAEEIQKNVGEGSEWSGEMQLLRKDGTAVPVLVALKPVHDERGRITGIVGATTDISEHLEFDESLRQSQKMEAMGRLAGGVAHDFNNLLTTISGYAELMLAELDPEAPVRDFAAEIEGAARRAKGLTSQLLAFSRKQALLPQFINPRQVIHGMEKLLRRVIGEHIEIIFRTEGRPVRILADPTQIEQVILNLAVNARDSMPLGGTLTISLENRRLDYPLPVGQDELPPGPYAVLSVQDTGSGIHPDVQGHVFEPFYTTKAEGKGTGLGLSTVYGIIQQSGGGILMDSVPGEGTTFSVFLPEIADGRSDEPGQAIRRERGINGEPAMEATRTILVAEDDGSVRALLARLLPRIGYNVLEAENGAEALELYREHAGEIDLVLTDIIMPVMSGPELVDRLDEERREVPVLFMSGYTDDMLERQNLASGIPLLQKPFTSRELKLKLAEATGERATEGD